MKLAAAPPTGRPSKGPGTGIRVLEVRCTRDTGLQQIVLEGGETLRVRSEDVAVLELTTGAFVTEAVLARLRKNNAAIRVAEQAHRLLSIRLRSRHELNDRLRRRGFPSAVIRDVLDQLQGTGFIDDERFAAAWVRGRTALRPSGAALLRLELGQKGIARNVVDRTVRDALGEQTELALARRVAQARVQTYRRFPYSVAYRRLAAFLQRRGFPASVIVLVLRETFGSSRRAGAPDG